MDFSFNFAMNDINADVLNSISATGNTIDSSTAAASMVLGGVAGFLVFFIIIACIIGFIALVLNFVAMWKVFTKAGEAGWKCLIPIYNTIVLYKIAGISPLWVLSYLAACIPVLGPLLILGVSIYAMVKLSRAFGKEDAFAVGLVLLNLVFMMILAFGKAEYQLNKDNVTENVTEEAKEVEKVEEEK